MNTIQRHSSVIFTSEMDPIEYRSVIKFFVRAGKTKEEILSQLSAVYEAECPSKSTVYFWIAEFKRGRENVRDDVRAGRPTEIDAESINKKCESIVRTERRITTKALATQLNVSDWKARDVLKSCGIRKLSSRFVPRFLTAEMCSRRLLCCEENLSLYQEHGQRFLTNIVTVDESPLSLYSPESKRESSEWCFPNESAPKKLRSGTQHGRCSMLTIFWDCQGVIKVDFAERNVKINSEYYASLVKETRALRRKPRGSPLWLLQDNAPIHTSQLTTKIIQEANFHLLPHPPYSPDLAPSDFWLFRHLKKHLRGHHFDSARVVQEATESFLAAQTPDFFSNAFAELVNRWEKCVKNKGSYIEK